ncbi:ribokinase [Aquisalibacillus elongatus]|uniref:Ribokinase n=1 Tax=Aquisalibacillus elongatus TaxID=485577 RepID=A0A3N5B9Q1_9BACI|nr:ribokinase [Aquisalibacillus elongatus]RPF52200.1 ribokinase [Aquisalibacillus elongatus]
MKRPKITVVGSINMDLVTETDQFPVQGETVRGSQFQTVPGGKGANQAVAAARLGADVTMVGCVGDDEFGVELLNNFNNEGIDSSLIKQIPNTSSGLANIILSDQDNRIIIIGGANEHVTPEYLDQVKKSILNSDYVLLQFEIPKETITYCIDLCDQHNIPLIVNPAPAMDLSPKLWERVQYITPNETEHKQLFNETFNDQLIVTKGNEGTSYSEEGKEQLVPSFNVDVVDTTGAGDTFNGALAVSLGEGKNLREAIEFANAAASLSVQHMGAQSGMPSKSEVKKLIDSE